ncbi:unnamed protein product [Phytophthora fragariaefolia]|uniref:Unnamed protein product n=1 Tax=Phytophthora fragariaefolia TaxID=1490495 RepID=A0A9W7CQV8_9STRA|nr:unnamed protein product [Phytophthora fragariaefolia]
MPKTNSKFKKTPRATDATPPEAIASAEETSPKETTTPRVNGATLVKSGSHTTKGKPTKAHAPATTTAPSAKSTRRTKANKRKEVRLPGPFRGGLPGPRATKPSEGESASASSTASEPTLVEEAAVPGPDGASDAHHAEDFINSSDSQDPKSSASATSPA